MLQKSNNGKIDIHNYKQKFEWIVKRIETKQDLLPSNIKTLLNYKQSLVVEGLSYPRMLKLLDVMLRISLWLGKDFKEVTRKDIDKLVEKIQSNDNRSAWTKQGYMVSIKRFFKWFYKSDEYPELVKHIKTSVAKNCEKIPEEMLTEEEVIKIIDVAENYRDRALVSLLYETGGRVGELGSLSIKHVELNDSEGYVTLHGKTGARRVFIKSSVPYLRKWLDVHPLRNDKDSALFVGIWCVGKNKPMNYEAIRKQVAELIKKAKVDKPANPHNFRHSRATFLAGYLTEAQLNYVMGWQPGSDMASVYVHLNGKDVNDAIRTIYGLGEEKRIKESKFVPKKCMICGELNEVNSDICGRCNNPLSFKGAVIRQMSSEDEKFENILKEMFWDKFKDKILQQIDPVQVKELLEEAEKASKASQIKAVSVS